MVGVQFRWMCINVSSGFSLRKKISFLSLGRAPFFFLTNLIDWQDQEQSLFRRFHVGGHFVLRERATSSGPFALLLGSSDFLWTSHLHLWNRFETKHFHVLVKVLADGAAREYERLLPNVS